MVEGDNNIQQRPPSRAAAMDGWGPQQLRLLTVPIVGLMPLSVGNANDLLVEWGHNLGTVHRPFRQEAFALEVDQRPISLAVSASIVSARVKGYSRTEVVELARLCTNPTHRWATRVMLRLWREIAAPRWSCWPVKAAIAYSQTRYHDGAIYRFDGWTLMDESAGSMGGGAWSRRRYATDAAYGRKRLWVWEY